MKKNAFTLIELIATIGLLGMLATITITISVRKINETKEKARDTMFESIELAAKNYVIDYGSELKQFVNNDNIYILLQTLVEKEYFTESLVDPTTKKSLPLTNEVYVTKEENGTITALYDINQRQNPKLTLIGSYNEYVKLGDNYDELGVIATSKEGNDVSNNVTITGSIDINTPNTYKVTYQLDNKKITRNVIVYNGNLSNEQLTIASKYIERLYKTNNYQNDGLIQTYATVDGKQVDAGIRYAGPLEGDNAVKNQVYFNCKDKYTVDSKEIKYGDEDYVYQGNCEVWRIIGVFDVDNGKGNIEKRVKIVRDKFTTSMSWDSSADGTNEGEPAVNKGNGINQWGDIKDSSGNIIYEGADLMRVLNGYYIGESNTCTYCNNSNQGTCPTSNNCASIVGQISSTSLKMIDDALWYTGATTFVDPLPLSAMYAGERSTQSGKICSSGDYCNDNVTRTTTWVGKIGLIYPSDYAYASTDASCASDIYGSNSTCNTNNWLHPSSGGYWKISPFALSVVASSVWTVDLSRRVSNSYAYNALGVRPALYLASNVKIKGGNGSSTSPYILAQ